MEDIICSRLAGFYFTEFYSFDKRFLSTNFFFFDSAFSILENPFIYT